MNTAHIFVCPGATGYEFSPSDRRIDARLLNLLAPTANELLESGPLVPILRADWLQPGWLAPKKTVVAMVGLRARLPASDIQRGSGSVWAVAVTFSVFTTPSPATLATKLVDLAGSLRGAVSERNNSQRFSNLTHLELRSFEAPVIEAVMERINCMAKSGSVHGSFQRVLNRAPPEA